MYWQEIDTTSGKVENVLAGRDLTALSKLLGIITVSLQNFNFAVEIEKIYTKTNDIQEKIQEHETKRKESQETQKVHKIN